MKNLKIIVPALVMSAIAVHADLVTSADSAVASAGSSVTSVGTTLVVLAASVVGIILIIRLFRRGQPG